MERALGGADTIGLVNRTIFWIRRTISGRFQRRCVSAKTSLEFANAWVDANIHRRTSIGRFEEKIGRLSDDSITGLLQSVSDVSSASCPNQYPQIDKLDQITMGGILDHIQMTDTPTARDVSGFCYLGDDFFLPFA